MTSYSNQYPKEIECPECGGEGRCEYEVAVVDYEHGGYLAGKMMECQLCEGYGEITVEEEEDELDIIVQLENTGSIH